MWSIIPHPPLPLGRPALRVFLVLLWRSFMWCSYREVYGGVPTRPNRICSLPSTPPRPVSPEAIELFSAVAGLPDTQIKRKQ
jgi:hypothetical protein